ncbi:MAG: DUF4493 domain-containing protein [Candidatus Cryptobacteroides sp.]
MKKILLSSIAVLSISCGKMPQAAVEYGKVDFSVRAENYVDESVKSSVSDYADLPVQSDFNILIKDSYGSQVYSGPVSEWDSETALSTGDYTVTASCSDPEEEGFGKAAFSGETAFTVEGGKTVPVNIDAQLANCIVKILVSESFSNYYPEYSFSLTTGLGNTIDFPMGETRAAFIYAYRFEVKGEMTSQGGTAKSFSKTYQTLEPATCYTLAFDVTGTGGSSISITFDDSVETVNLEDIELNE